MGWLDNIKNVAQDAFFDEEEEQENAVWDRRIASIQSIEKHQPSFFNYRLLEQKLTKFLVYNDKLLPIDWEKVIVYNNNDNWALPRKCYRVYKPHKRDIRQFVVHWDVCLSSSICFDVLKKRKLSVHFLIDNDGTIIQTMDLNHKALHAGNKIVNRHSIGVEMSNAYYPKYNKWYKRKGFGERPIWKDVKVHGTTLQPFLGFYPVQIKALKALNEALINAKLIKQDVPLDNNGELETSVVPSAVSGEFRGTCAHYHITRRKIDVAGLDLDSVVFGE